jgi:hypothetical protein
MQNMRKSFMKRLRLDGPTVNRWIAEQELRRHDHRLHKISDKESDKAKEQEAIVGQWLDKCTKLMLTLVKDTTSMVELREILDSAYDFDLQLRMLKSSRAAFIKAVPALRFNKDTFFQFVDGVRMGQLYNRMIMDPKTTSSYNKAVMPMAMKLQDEIALMGSLAPLANFPTTVQYYALGDMQCVLAGKIQGKIPIQTIREAVAGLKDELNPDTEADTKIALLRYLRSNQKRAPFHQSLIRKKVKTLPVEILLTKMQNTAEPKDLKAAILAVLRKMPEEAAVPAMHSYGREIAAVAPEGFEVMVGEAIAAYMKSS